MPDDTQEPTGDLTFLEGHDPDALAELADAGIGEGDFDGDDHGVPPDLVELYEVIEWENGLADAEGRELPHPDFPVPPPHDPGTPGSTPLVSRAGWGAQPPTSVSHNVKPEGDTGHYGGPSPWTGSTVDRSSAARFEDTTDHARCAAIMRAYQRYHMVTKGWSDFAYNGAFCPHGTRYMGRGPGVRSAAQGTTDGNNRSYACVYLAGDSDPMPEPAQHAAADWEAVLLEFRWGHRDWKSTSCPGDPFYRWIKAGGPRPGIPVPAPQPTGRPTLRVGSQGSYVRLWQTVLAGAGLLPRSGIDGIFGPKTEAATRAFQVKLRVAADGIVGPITWAATDALLRYLAALEAAKARPPFPGTVRQGSRGAAVRTWQAEFNRHGYQLAVDGIFGPATNHVVRHWQSRHGLAVDGIAGPKTWASLTR